MTRMLIAKSRVIILTDKVQGLSQSCTVHSPFSVILKLGLLLYVNSITIGKLQVNEVNNNWGWSNMSSLVPPWGKFGKEVLETYIMQKNGVMKGDLNIKVSLLHWQLLLLDKSYIYTLCYWSTLSSLLRKRLEKLGNLDWEKRHTLSWYIVWGLKQFRQLAFCIDLHAYHHAGKGYPNRE